MKRIICFVMLICVMLSTQVTAAGESELTQGNVFYYDNKEVYITSDGIDYDTMKKLADSIAYGDDTDNASTYGIACLFGHDIATSAATELIHNVYTTSPKCVMKYYDIEYCTRSSCDYIERTVTRAIRYATCHG